MSEKNSNSLQLKVDFDNALSKFIIDKDKAVFNTIIPRIENSSNKYSIYLAKFLSENIGIYIYKSHWKTSGKRCDKTIDTPYLSLLTRICDRVQKYKFPVNSTMRCLECPKFELIELSRVLFKEILGVEIETSLLNYCKSPKILRGYSRKWFRYSETLLWGDFDMKTYDYSLEKIFVYKFIHEMTHIVQLAYNENFYSINTIQKLASMEGIAIRSEIKFFQRMLKRDDIVDQFAKRRLNYSTILRLLDLGLYQRLLRADFDFYVHELNGNIDSWLHNRKKLYLGIDNPDLWIDKFHGLQGFARSYIDLGLKYSERDFSLIKSVFNDQLPTSQFSRVYDWYS